MTYNDQILLLSGLVEFWPLDDASGTSARDLGPGNDPATYSGVTLGETSGIPSQPSDPSVKFDAGDYITLPTTSVDFTAGVTFIFWAKPTVSANHARFVDLGAGAGDLEIMMYRSSTGNAMTLDVFNSGGDHAVLTETTGVIENDVWHLYIGTVWADGYAAIYRDGGLADDRVGMSLPLGGTRDSNWIGRSNFGNPSPDAWYEGWIQGVAILNRGITPAEVEAVTNAGTAAASDLPLLSVQVAWDNDLAGTWPDIWTQAYARLEQYACIYACQVDAAAGNPGISDDTCTVTFTNNDGLYDPWNPGSPVQPHLGVGRLARVLVTQSGITRCVFAGKVAEYEPSTEPEPGRGYGMVMRIDSYLKWLLDTEVEVPSVYHPVPYDPDDLGNSLLPKIFRNTGAVVDFETDTTLLLDADGQQLLGSTQTIGAWLSTLAEATHGTYFCQPLYRTTLSGLDYKIVWKTAASLRTESVAWTAVDINGDLEPPARAVYGVEGLAA